MDEHRSATRAQRTEDIKSHAVAFVMLGLSLFALYTHTLYLAIIPLLWMAFRAGKEQGREAAHRDLEQASALAQMIRIPEAEQARSLMRANASTRVTRFPQ